MFTRVILFPAETFS